MRTMQPTNHISLHNNMDSTYSKSKVSSFLHLLLVFTILSSFNDLSCHVVGPVVAAAAASRPSHSKNKKLHRKTLISKKRLNTYQSNQSPRRSRRRTLIGSKKKIYKKFKSPYRYSNKGHKTHGCHQPSSSYAYRKGRKSYDYHNLASTSTSTSASAQYIDHQHEHDIHSGNHGNIAKGIPLPSNRQYEEYTNGNKHDDDVTASEYRKSREYDALGNKYYDNGHIRPHIVIHSTPSPTPQPQQQQPSPPSQQHYRLVANMRGASSGERTTFPPETSNLQLLCFNDMPLYDLNTNKQIGLGNNCISFTTDTNPTSSTTNSIDETNFSFQPNIVSETTSLYLACGDRFTFVIEPNFLPSEKGPLGFVVSTNNVTFDDNVIIRTSGTSGGGENGCCIFPVLQTEEGEDDDKNGSMSSSVRLSGFVNITPANTTFSFDYIYVIDFIL